VRRRSALLLRALLGVLIRLYPAPFRRRFGEEIREQVAWEVGRARERGRGAALREVAAQAWDLVRGAAAERWAPTWVDDGRRLDDEGTGMKTMLREWAQELKQAVRSLARVPGFALVAVGTLALAIGVNTALFALMDAVVLQPLPYGEPDELVHVAGTAPGTDLPEEFQLSPEFFHQYREAEGLSDVAVWTNFTNTARLGDRVERIVMGVASWNLFETLEVEPMLGRLPAEADPEPNVVLSHAMWTDWFGRDPDVVGRTIWAGGESRTITGVLGPDFWFPYEGVQLWIPSPMRIDEDDRPRFRWGMVARLNPGVGGTLEEELAGLASRIPERYGWSAADARVAERHRPVIRPLDEELLGDARGPLWVLLGSVALVLLIACANVANLFLVRVEHRRRGMAVRTALGAGRARRLRTLMAEAVVVAGVAGVLAVGLALICLPVLVQGAPGFVPRLSEVRLTPTALAVAGGLSVAAALLCGLGPSLRGSRGDLGPLRDGLRGSTGRGGRWRDLLVAGQTALALVLLVGSGLLARSFVALSEVDPGYDTRELLTFQIAPEQDQLVDGPSYARFHQAFSERLAALPGVESTGIVENVPLDEGLAQERFLPAGSTADPATAPLVSYTMADGDYFSTMGVRLLAGRTFTGEEETGGVPAVVLGESAARILWSGADPVGRRLRTAEGETLYTVIGVVEDVLQYDLRQEPRPMLYLPLVGPTPTSWALPSPGHVVRSPRAAQLVPEIRALVREVAPEAPMYRVYTMESLAAESMQGLTSTLLILGVTSALALILGMIGLFGVLSYAVARRTREIGVRMALGADAGRVRALVVGQGIRVVAVGIIGGLVMAWVASGVLRGMLYGVEPGDPLTFGGVAAAMLGVGGLASWIPAWRASRVQPVESLNEV
jgi:predicted permease